MRQRTLNNEHSLGPWRVNGVVQNMPEFAGMILAAATTKWSARTPAASGEVFADHTMRQNRFANAKERRQAIALGDRRSLVVKDGQNGK